jgi:hypothetical protein
VQDTLKLMGRSPGERLTPELARDLCQRAGSKAYLSGSIAGLGSQYVIGLKAVNCQTGDSLAQEQVTADSKEHVLTALDAVATKLRGKVGESLSTMYGVYVRGEAYLAAHQGSAAEAEFQRIIDHPGIVMNNPNGALAHLGLARAYVLQGDSAKAKAAYRDFLTLWKDADPDIPILIAAKSEYAKLK